MKHRLIIEQKITAFTNKYSLFGIDTKGEKGERVAFAQQKRLAFKERVSFYGDEQKSQVEFTFRAEKVLDVHGKYLVEDSHGTLLGSFQKLFKASLINSTWHVLTAEDEPVLVVRESSQLLAVMRRVGGFIPILGDIIEILTVLLRYHFVISRFDTNEAVGTYKKTTLFRDHYLLSLTDEAVEAADWRVFAGLGVGLDALQSR